MLPRNLKIIFPKEHKPLVIVNVGGFSDNTPLPSKKKEKCYKTLIDSLMEIDQEGVEIIPQTMPPYPWHLGGQRYHNNICRSLGD